MTAVVPARSELLIALHPVVARKLADALVVCHGKNLNVYLFEGMRLPERQDFLYESGRTLPGKIITNAKGGSSFHQYGLAGDLVFKDEHGHWSWDGDYEAVGKIMTAAGFEWGKSFKGFPELDHFQMVWGLDIEEAIRLHQKAGMRGVWQRINELSAKK